MSRVKLTKSKLVDFRADCADENEIAALMWITDPVCQRLLFSVLLEQVFHATEFHQSDFLCRFLSFLNLNPACKPDLYTIGSLTELLGRNLEVFKMCKNDGGEGSETGTGVNIQTVESLDKRSR